jgi:general stress protein 26
MESVQFCMLSTWNGTKLRSRPMGAFVQRQEGVIYFFTDVRAHKDEEIREFPKVCLAFAETGGQKYVSVSGIAEINSDRNKIKELWSIPVKIWWESPEDPNIASSR